MFVIIIGLVVTLVILAIIINAVQQHKEKAETEKRNELAKHKLVIEETEGLLMNAANIPMSKQLVLILNQRVLDAVKAMSLLTPESMDVKQRLRDAQQRVGSIDVNEKMQTEEKLSLPDDDRMTIGIIQGIKKLRITLRTEHTKGKVDTHLFMNEDRKLDRLQLKINVESLLKRGNTAKEGEMLGSARQYYEKALATIDAQTTPDEYSNKRKAEITASLSEITTKLKSTNTKDRLKKEEDSKDDLDMLFQPKKKW